MLTPTFSSHHVPLAGPRGSGYQWDPITVSNHSLDKLKGFSFMLTPTFSSHHVPLAGPRGSGYQWGQITVSNHSLDKLKGFF